MADQADGFYAYFPPADAPQGSPHSIDSWCPPEFSNMVRAICAHEHFDVVFAQLVFMSRCLAAVDDTRTLRVLDADNIFAFRHERFIEAGLPYNWLRPTLEEEAEAWARADLVIAVQENEADVMRQALPSTPVLSIPAARDDVQELGTLPDGTELLIVGTDSAQNRAGVTAFIDRALPIIRTAWPEARLLLAGRVGSGFGDQGNGIIELGVVEDLIPYYRQATIVVAPLPAGTGLIRKSIDALCFGKCLVATPGALQGIEGYPEAYVRCETIDEMGPAIVELLGDRSRLSAIADRAFEFASTYFDAPAVFERLETALLAGIESKERSS